MNLLKKFEKKLENLIEGTFSKGFPSQVQPVEIAKKLDNDMLDNKTVTLSRTFAPNVYEVFLSTEDYKHLEGFKDSIIKEISDYLHLKAEENGLYLKGLEVSIEPEKDLKLGIFKTQCRLAKEVQEELKKQSSPQHTQIISKEDLAQSMNVVAHVIEEPVSKKVFKVFKPVTVVGRSKVCDLTVGDPSISRKHFELVIEGEALRLADLGSTNGTRVNGTKVKAKMLRDGDKITLGKTALIYRRRNG